jgi:uncharacterized protein
MQIQSPAVHVRFAAQHLVSRRTFVFARAGFGKSNLNKLLFSKLYERTPTVLKRGGRAVPVGTVIFDPEGEYFWPDDKGRPGLCDNPSLADNVVVFTSRRPPSPFYGSFVAGGIKLDVRRLSPSDVISIALSPEKQDQQNVRKLRAMKQTDWARLVDLVDSHGNAADLSLIQDLLHLDTGQDAEALAARANMTAIVRMLHDRHSQLMDMLLQALSAGKLCIIDASQLRGGASLILSGLILRRIFDRNQEEFTKAEPRTIPTIAVVEEAQAVLNERSSAAAPYIEWVKEGRKYDLGAVLITQQPGSIPTELLSQGDNWFVFHLLSAADLQNVQRANAHFSDDLLSSLLNEPIKGQGVFWSSVGGSPFPVPLRVASFEKIYRLQDPQYDREAVDVYACRLRRQFDAQVRGESADVIVPVTGPLGKIQGGLASNTRIEPAAQNGQLLTGTDADRLTVYETSGEVDPFQLHQQRAIDALRNNVEFQRDMGRSGVPWGKIVGLLREALPPTMADRSEIAYQIVPEALTQVLGGKQGEVWTTERRGAKNTTFVVRVVQDGSH